MALDVDALIRELTGSLGQGSAVAGAQRQAQAARDARMGRQAQITRMIGMLGSAGGGPTGNTWIPVQPGTGRGGQAVAEAMRLLGKPYVWGGVSINGVDCSGLVYRALRAAGVNVPRLRASGFGQMGTPETAAQARPGDVVYFDNPGATDHVGIYVGGGRFIEAQQPGTRVMTSPLRAGAQLRRVF